jgi:uncharacterized cofD-like protein
MVSWRWLQPGLHLKRWVLAICAGMVFLILGAISLGLGIFDLKTPRFPGTTLPADPYAVAEVLIGLGSILVFAGVYRLVRRIERLLKSKEESRGLAEIAYQHIRLEQGPRMVCLGGGTGLSTILYGLREYSGDITAIVSVADDGGSSGRLRLDFEMLPPGDIRNCLIALADAGPVMADLMQYRFEEGELAGHSFGNLFITVLAQLRGNFGLAVREANRILSVRGQVLPATLEKVNLVATHPDGSKTTGQRLIAKCGKPIEELSLKPKPGQAPEDVIEAIRNAELIIIGPGSLYTSVLPTLLDEDVVEAIGESRAQVFYIVNTMSQPGETEEFTASRYLETLWKHVPGLRIDCAVVNGYRPSAKKLEELAVSGVKLTEYDRKEMASLEVRVLLRDVVDSDSPQKHHPQKLAKAVMEAFAANRK